MILTYKLFNENNIQNYTDSILDKILDSGIDSLSSEERKFLDSHKTNNQEEVLKNIKNKFEDVINGIVVKFEYKGSKKIDSYLVHYGNINLNGTKLKGGIYISPNDIFETIFENDKLTDWDIIEDSEYEYEQFIENIINELSNNYELI